ncbi:MAG: hypothetical protein ABIJ46_02560 [bacterium]
MRSFLSILVLTSFALVGGCGLEEAENSYRGVPIVEGSDDNCGNGVCEAGEFSEFCPEDCPVYSYCGDGQCAGDETAGTCPVDCRTEEDECEHRVRICDADGFQLICVFRGGADGTGALVWARLECDEHEACSDGECVAVPWCGDGECGDGEDAETCPDDCGADCGDGFCTHDEDCGSCEADCGCDGEHEACVEGECVVVPWCGDDECGDGETCADCVEDCGECPPACGNGVCNPYEDCDSCPADCGCDGEHEACVEGECVVDPFCGDGECDAHEDCSWCDDCLCASGESCSDGECVVDPYCGDGICDPHESCDDCEVDCDVCPPRCGDDECSGAEDCNTCQDDCGDCPAECGDGECTGDESCSGCPADCGGCPSECGNGVCEYSEFCDTCPDDCDECPSYCGDGICDPDSCEGDESCCESPATCPSDCSESEDECERRERRCSEDGLVEICIHDYVEGRDEWTPVYCPAGTVCEDGTCLPPEPAFCGDGTCDDDESCGGCPDDCGCGDGRSCIDGACVVDPVCGDGECNGEEACDTCPDDCDPCPEEDPVSTIRCTLLEGGSMQIDVFPPLLLMGRLPADPIGIDIGCNTGGGWGPYGPAGMDPWVEWLGSDAQYEMTLGPMADGCNLVVVGSTSRDISWFDIENGATPQHMSVVGDCELFWPPEGGGLFYRL